MLSVAVLTRANLCSFWRPVATGDHWVLTIILYTSGIVHCCKEEASSKLWHSGHSGHLALSTAHTVR